MKKLIAFSLAAAALSACILPPPHHDQSNHHNRDRGHSEIYGEIKGGMEHQRSATHGSHGYQYSPHR